MSGNPQPDLPGHDRLDRATAALRASGTNESPPPDLLGGTVAALQAAAQQATAASPEATLVLRPTPERRRRSMFRLVSMSGAAAAALLAAATLWLFPVNHTRGSFAEVVKHVKQARNVRFMSTQKLLSGSPVITMRHTIDGPRMRMDIGDIVSIIADLGARQGIELQYFSKAYRPVEVSEKAAQAFLDPVGEFTKLGADDGEYLGTEPINGRPANAYRLSRYHFMGIDATRGARDDAVLTLWADVETWLPVKVELKIYQELAKEWSTITMTDFLWNLDLPADFFSVEPPAGYTKVPPLQGNVIQPDEADEEAPEAEPR
jgi:outer membrane lipoprotein-sorting protein